MCIMLVFLAAGCKEAYDRYGGNSAAKKTKKKHDTIGGYGAVDQEEADVEAPSIMTDLKGLMGGGAGAIGNGVGGVTGGMEKGLGIFTAVAKNMTSDIKKAGVAAADKAKTGVSDAANLQAHLDKVKQGASMVGNVATAAADDAKKGAEAAAAKGLDTARSASDVSAHLEKAKAAAQMATNVATSAANDAAKASQEAAAKAASVADPSKLVDLAKDSVSKVGEVANAAADAAKDTAHSAASALSVNTPTPPTKEETATPAKDNKSTGKKKGKKEAVQAVEDQRVEASSPVAPQAEAEPPLTISDAEKAKLVESAAKTEEDVAPSKLGGDVSLQSDDTQEEGGKATAL